MSLSNIKKCHLAEENTDISISMNQLGYTMHIL